MYYFILVLIVLAALALILAVLVQKSKGSGLASGFASSNQIMGVRKTTDVVEKATWGLAIAIVLLSLGSSAFFKSGQKQSTQQSVIDVPPLPGTNTPDVNTTIPMPGTTPAPAPQPEQE